MTHPVVRLVRGCATGLAGVVCLALTTGPAGPAAAETQVRTDPRGDTVELEESRAGGADGTAGPADNADVLQLRATHDRGRLTFVFTVADLVVEPGRDAAAYARFVSPGGRDWTASIVRSAGGEKSLLLVDNIAGAERSCEGLTGHANQATDRLVVSVPRACVNRPRSVRFGGTALGLQIFEPVGYVERVWEDDARLVGRTGTAAKIGTRDLVLGRRAR